MDSATIHGQTYIKASKAAKEAGYTADYAGQLARKGAIDAVVLGKTWFVREGALLEHKKARARANTQMVKREFERQKEDAQNEQPAWMAFVPAYRERLLAGSVRYTSDQDELLPMVRKEETKPEVEKEEESVAEQPAADVQPVSIRVMTKPEIDEHTATDEEVEEEAKVVADPRQAARDRQEAVQTLLTRKQAPVRRRRRLVPALAVIALLTLASANLVVYSNWNYEEGVTGGAELSTDYQIASLGSVIDRLQEVQF